MPPVGFEPTIAVLERAKTAKTARPLRSAHFLFKHFFLQNGTTVIPAHPDFLFPD
jgi:hypothetical protein